MPRKVTLLLPGILQLEQPIYLTNLLKKANWYQAAASYEETLLNLFALPASSEAPILAWHEGISTKENYWLTLTPLCTQADMHTAYVIGHAKDYLSSQELEDIFNTVRNFLAQDNIILHQGKNHWFVETKEPVPLTSVSWINVVGNPLTSYLLKSQIKYWNNLQAELQMLLFNHAHNVKRRHQGLTTCDLVWFSNSGMLPKASSSPYTQVWTDEELSKALCSFTQTPVEELCLEHSFMDKIIAKPGNYLISSLHYPHEPEKLDRYLFEPLFKFLKKGYLSDLICYVGPTEGMNGTCFSLASKVLSFWNFLSR